MTVQKLDEGGLVDRIQEAGRVYVRTSDLGLRRLQLFRTFTRDFKVKLEEELSSGKRHRLTQLLGLADDGSGGPPSAGVVNRAVKRQTG